MRKTVFLLASLFVMACGIQSVKAQSGAQASATADAKATVVEAITINKTADLDFGTFASGLTTGTVEMGTDGNRYQTGGVVLIGTGTDAGNPATFTVHGTNNGSYSVSFPTNPVTLSSGTEQMTIASFTHNAGAGTLDGTGQATFNVGGVLTVAANQPAGVYTGTFDVIVTHQ